MLRRSSLATVLVVMLVPCVIAFQDLTQKDSDAFAKKLAAIVARSNKPPVKPPAPPLTTSLLEREINGYFKFGMKDDLPQGVIDPQITILGPGRLDGRAVVDLDIVRKSKERGLLDPMRYMSGQVEIRASGTFTAANGMGTVQLISASFGGVPLPKAVLQEIVYFYSRTPDMPAGFDMDKPFELPAGIRGITTQRGITIIVQ